MPTVSGRQVYSFTMWIAPKARSNSRAQYYGSLQFCGGTGAVSLLPMVSVSKDAVERQHNSIRGPFEKNVA